MKRVVLFFGSFNPIHIGHLALANYVAEYADVDEVRFVVSPQNPFKQQQTLMADEFRLEMVKQAIESYDKFSVSDIEFSMSKPSYTYETLTRFVKMEPDSRFSLLMGSDNLLSFDKWRNYEWILQNFSLFVYPRMHFEISIPEKWKMKVVPLMEAPVIEISSTFIRQSILQKKNVRFFVPSEVWNMLSSI